MVLIEEYLTHHRPSIPGDKGHNSSSNLKTNNSNENTSILHTEKEIHQHQTINSSKSIIIIAGPCSKGYHRLHVIINMGQKFAG